MRKMCFCLFFVLLISQNVYARTPCDDGEINCWECGEDCTARFDPSTKTFNVAGTGPMANLATAGQAANVPWYAIRGSVEHITFDGSISSLSMYAFYDMPVKNVTIPSSVSSLEFGAFYKSGLESVIIPDSVTSIGNYVFSLNSQLTTVVVNDKLKFGVNLPFSLNNENLKIYCTGDLQTCQENVGPYADKVIKATKKQINGVTYVYDANGKLCAKSGTRKNKRIYTLEEATAVSKKTGNRFMIRYK